MVCDVWIKPSFGDSRAFNVLLLFQVLKAAVDFPGD